MIFLGHIGIALLFGTLISLSILPLIIGAILPDLIDKPFQLLGIFPSGRFIGHTLFTGIVVTILSFPIFRKKQISISLLFGFLFHLLEDSMYFIPWFYPFINYDFAKYPFGPIFTPLNILFEFVGAMTLVYIFHSNSQFRNLIVDNFKILINKKKISE